VRFREYDVVVLARDLPKHGLRRGAKGAIVHVHSPGIFEVEFHTASGDNLAVVTLEACDLSARVGLPERPVRSAWDASLRYWVPLVGLFVLARATNGWLSIVGWIAFFGLFVGLVVVGIRDQTRGWESSDDLPGERTD